MTTKLASGAKHRTELFQRACLSICLLGCAPAAAVPLPPPRPPDLIAPAPDQPASPDSSIQPTDGDNATLRASALAGGRIIGESLAPIVDKGGCGIAAPLRLDAIVLADGAKVAISPPAIMRASLALALADWVREDLAPSVAASGDRLAKITGTGAYTCRDRNGIAGAKLSEHAKGNALDLQAFVTQRGTRYAVAAAKIAAPAGTKSFLALMKTTACRRFMTVLGPGSDLYHTQHLHIDLEARRHGTHLCQWSLPDEPVPVGAPKKRARNSDCGSARAV